MKDKNKRIAVRWYTSLQYPSMTFQRDQAYELLMRRLGLRGFHRLLESLDIWAAD